VSQISAARFFWNIVLVYLHKVLYDIVEKWRLIKMSQEQQVTKPKKRLTRQQRWWRHSIRQALFFSLSGVILSLIMVGFVSLVTLPFQGPSEPPEPSMVEAESVPTETPEASPEVSEEPEVQTMTLVAVGDNLIHSTIIDYGLQEDGTYDFTDIYSYVQSDIENADLACIQQETIYITDPNQYTNYPEFGTPAEMADSLTAVGFDVVCHASNHTYDKLQAGIDDTLAAWKKHPEVTVLGIHGSQEDADTIAVVERNGIKLALLDYTYGVNYSVPEEDYTIDFMDEDHKERIAQQIAKAKEQSDMVVVFMHDGTEDSFTPNEEQISWAQFFADNGVGLVIGTHPHVVEPTDVIIGQDGNEMPVFYSLGNFVSSQKDNFNMLGGMANVTITKDETGTYVSDYSISPIVTWIQSGGTNGLGYIFHPVHLEDYTEEMAAEHIRENCTPEAFETLWDEIFAEPEDEDESSDLAA
jgi:poly-gamma-glutamate synthesis protein (capsule biosynthesis protein)